MRRAPPIVSSEDPEDLLRQTLALLRRVALRLCHPRSPLHLGLAEHGPSTLLRAAVAIAFGIIAVIEVVLIRQLLSSSNIPNRTHKDPSLVLFRLTVRCTGVVDEHSRPEPIDHRPRLAAAKQMAVAAQDAIRQGRLGYVIVTATIPI